MKICMRFIARFERILKVFIEAKNASHKVVKKNDKHILWRIRFSSKS
jgi:hypothetical protein